MKGRPLGAVLLLLLWLAVTALAGRPVEDGATIVEAVSSGVLRQFVLAVLLLAAAAVLLRWRGLGFRTPRRGTLRLLWLPGLYLLLFAALVLMIGLPPAGVAAVLLANTLLVGFSEEVMFRGFLYSGLRDRLSVWSAAWITSLLFGAVHVMNVGVSGHLQAALLQSVAAAMLGLLFLGLRLRIGSIWPAVLLHTAWNYGLILIGRNAQPMPSDEPIPFLALAAFLLFVLPLGFYGLWLVRGPAREGDGLGKPGPAPSLAARPAA